MISLISAEGWHERFSSHRIQPVVVLVIQNEPLAFLPQIHFEHPVVVVVVRDHLQCGRTPYVGALNGSTARIKEVPRPGPCALS